jgi:septal ring factor EnvC (AmiA/AmiB activator)
MQQQRFKFSLLIIISLSFNTIFAQKSDVLREERNEMKAAIEQTNSAIKTTEKKRKTVYQQYLDLKKNAGSKQEMVKTMEGDIENINIRVVRQEEVVTALAADLSLMKERYAALLQKIYRQNHKQQQVIFLLSAIHFNDLLVRWRFLKQYHLYKRRQVQLIKNTQVNFEIQNSLLAELQTEKELIIDTIRQEAERLGIALKEKKSMITKLSEAEKSLKIKLQKQQKSRERLNDDIQGAITAENRAARKRARKKGTLTNNESLNLSKKEQEISKNFRKNKGKLSMPAKGKIVGKFGIRVHREINNVKTESPGIEIQTAANANVNVIFDVIVVKSFFRPGLQRIVMVKHGDYYTVYSNLKSTVVKKGDKVKTGQIIGKVGTKNNKTELLFQIWNQGNKEDPEKWILD